MIKTWWIVALGLSVASIAQAASNGVVVPLKDGDGKVLAQMVLCGSCENSNESGKTCYNGAPEGWLDGKPCGQCLLKNNWGVMIRHSRDLSLIGRLIRPDGTPGRKHYVKLFMPNGWGGRTQTNTEGHFRLLLGATAERQKGAPIVVDLGERTDVKHPGGEEFSIYLMPDAFVACGEKPK